MAGVEGVAVEVEIRKKENPVTGVETMLLNTFRRRSCPIRRVILAEYKNPTGNRH